MKTTDEKRQELKDAGVKVHHKAGDKKINGLYAETFPDVETIDENTDGSGADADALAAIVVEDTEMEETIEVESVSDSGICPIPESIRSGDKTPEVVDWYRKNLTAEQFSAKYDGRIYPGSSK